MRIRSTKPEFWRSKLIASVPWDARLVLKALESYVDDNGVGEDDVNTLVGDCFLHDLIREPSRTLARTSEAISALHQAGLIWRYTVEGRNLLYVSFWETVQRIDKPQAGRNPRPDGTSNYKDSIIRESVATPRDASLLLAPGTGEQGNRGTGDQGAEEQSSASEVADATPRHDVNHLLDLLDAEIISNGGRKPTRTKKNTDAMRLLIDKDEHTVEQIERAIRWCQGNEFWRANILSASKLREKYDQLRLAAARELGTRAVSKAQQRQEGNLSVVAQLAAMDGAEQKGIEG